MSKKTIVLGVIGSDCHAVGNKILDYSLSEAGYEIVLASISYGDKPFFPINEDINVISLFNSPGRTLYRTPNIIYKVRKLLNWNLQIPFSPLSRTNPQCILQWSAIWLTSVRAHSQLSLVLRSAAAVQSPGDRKAPVVPVRVLPEARSGPTAVLLLARSPEHTASASTRRCADWL